MGEASVNGDMPHSAVLSVSPTWRFYHAPVAPTTNSYSGSLAIMLLYHTISNIDH
jgi:hypothetical protein